MYDSATTEKEHESRHSSNINNKNSMLKSVSKKSNVRTTDLTSMIKIFRTNPDSVTHEEFLMVQKAVGFGRAAKLIEEGRKREGQSYGKSAKKNNSKARVDQKAGAVLEKSSQNVASKPETDGHNCINYNVDNPLGAIANKLKMKMGSEISIGSQIDLFACKANMKLTVGNKESQTVFLKEGPFSVALQDNARKLSADMNIGGASISDSIGVQELETTLGKSCSAFGYTYSLSKSYSLTNTKLEYSISTNPKKGEPKITLAVSINYDNLKTALVAATVIIGVLILPEALEAAAAALGTQALGVTG
jgi:hypothetical protein